MYRNFGDFSGKHEEFAHMVVRYKKNLAASLWRQDQTSLMLCHNPLQGDVASICDFLGPGQAIPGGTKQSNRNG